MAKTIALVGCGASKLPGRHRARDLYTSQLFKKSLRYAEAHADRVFIVSALHGLVEPDRLISSYEARLASRAAAEHWGERVFAELAEQFREPVRLLILAGATYAGALRRAALEHGWAVEEQLRGLGIGRRLSFLKHAEVSP